MLCILGGLCAAPEKALFEAHAFEMFASASYLISLSDLGSYAMSLYLPFLESMSESGTQDTSILYFHRDIVHVAFRYEAQVIFNTPLIVR